MPGKRRTEMFSNALMETFIANQGGKEMRPDVFWIHAPLIGRLAIMPRPRAGEWLDDEIIGWQMEGIDTVVSLLELAEISELGLEREARSEEHTSELQSHSDLVCRLLLEKKKK